METDTPRSLPHRPGYVQIHNHWEGERCIVRPQVGQIGCRYAPSLLTRIRRALGL